MPISTQDCKNFIGSISALIESDNSWKRIKKYKDNSLILRDFQNQEGRTLTIGENNGKLFLYQLSPYMVKPQEWGVRFLGHPAKDHEVFDFIAHCIKEDSDIVGEGFSTDEDNLRAIKDGVKPESWTVWESWTGEALQEFIADASEYWIQLNLYYGDGNGNRAKVDTSNLTKIFWVGMPDYDTAYRIYIFETKNHTLLLGCNDSD